MGENNFIVEPIGGLSNRLRVIMAAKTLCEELGLNLKINWLYDSRFCHEMRKSEICGTHFLEVFEPLQTVKNTEISFVSTPELPTVKNGENFYRGTDVGFARIRVSEFYKKLTAQYKFLKPRAYLREQIDLLTKRREIYQKAIEHDLERLHEDLEEQKQLLKDFLNNDNEYLRIVKEIYEDDIELISSINSI